MAANTGPRAPSHLRPTTRKWWSDVVKTYEMGGTHIMLLTSACESWDRLQAAREVIDKEGPVFIDRWSQPRQRPEVDIERHCRASFERTVRLLGLTNEEPDA